MIAIALPALVAVCGGARSAEAKSTIHFKGPWGSVWINTGPLEDWLGLNSARTAGTLNISQPTLSSPPAAMDLMMTLPAGGGSPGGPADGLGVTNVLGSVDVSGVGGTEMAMASWGVWITWGSPPPHGIHITPRSNWGGALLSRTAVNPDGTMDYAAHGLAVPIDLDIVLPDGSHSLSQEVVTDLEWSSSVPLPAPSAMALLGAGGVMAARRRRR